MLKGIAAHYVMQADDRVGADGAAARAARRAGRGAGRPRRRGARAAVRRRLGAPRPTTPPGCASSSTRSPRSPTPARSPGTRRLCRMSSCAARGRPVTRSCGCPFDPAEPRRPARGRCATRRSTPPRHVPDSVGEVEFYVPPYRVGSRGRARCCPRCARCEVVQTLTAGVDNVRGRTSPTGVTLCNGRGIHDTSTAELALTLMLASLRGVPGFVRAQDRHAWPPRWRPALADKRVLLVGYGAIGEAIEARLRAVRGRRGPGRTDAPATACTPSTSCPTCCPRPTSWSWSCRSPTPPAAWSTPTSWPAMKDGALLVNVARGPVVVTDDLVAALHVRTDHRGRSTWSTPSRCRRTARCGTRPGCWSPRTSAARAARCGRAPTGWCATSCTAIAAGEPLANVVSGDSSWTRLESRRGRPDPRGEHRGGA